MSIEHYCYERPSCIWTSGCKLLSTYTTVLVFQFGHTFFALTYHSTEFLTKFATVRMSLTGEAFMDAGRAATDLLRRNLMDTVGVSWIPGVRNFPSFFLLACTQLSSLKYDSCEWKAQKKAPPSLFYFPILLLPTYTRCIYHTNTMVFVPPLVYHVLFFSLLTYALPYATLAPQNILRFACFVVAVTWGTLVGISTAIAFRKNEVGIFIAALAGFLVGSFAMMVLSFLVRYFPPFFCFFSSFFFLSQFIRLFLGSVFQIPLLFRNSTATVATFLILYLYSYRSCTPTNQQSSVMLNVIDVTYFCYATDKDSHQVSCVSMFL
jgi:hypothetical protein